jgi:quinol monooxygenase YgiN
MKINYKYLLQTDRLTRSYRYTNAEAHKAHIATSHFKSFGGQMQGFLAGPLDLKFGPLVAGYESKGKANL